MKLRIDGQELELDGPISIWNAARRLGIRIPALCHEEGIEHFTSCMICRVKEKKSGRLLPACSAAAEEGMEIETVNAEIRAFRKSTLEFLLSDHVGDCEAVCQRLCPIHMEAPRMLRELKAGKMGAAILTVRTDMAIPSILERYCHAPCERGCRRGKQDEPVSIREMVRHVADGDLRREEMCVPTTEPSSGKRVAILGAGATGLAAAYYLALRGHASTIFERTSGIGGRIETEFGRPLEPWVAEGELRLLRRLGVEFRFERPILDEPDFNELRSGFEAVVLACGRTDPCSLKRLGLPATEKGLKVNLATFETEMKGVFAGGSILKPAQPLIKSVDAAKKMAVCIDQFLRGTPIVGLPEKYNHTMGRLLAGEMEVFLSGANPIPRMKLEEGESDFTETEAASECGRCLHCDCRAKDDCLLREYADEYDARQAGFAGEERGRHMRNVHAGVAVYEPGKCIKCGLCVRLTEREGERFGFTFVGRGFDVAIGVSMSKPLAEGLGAVAEKVIAACPTGALAAE